MTTMAVSEARRRFREVLALARSGEDVNLTAHGEVVAVLVHPDALRRRRTSPATEQAADLLVRLDGARGATGPVRTGMSARRASTQVREIRADRDVR